MVLNNKVLTVSYGTFSCTLEGFDDSFGTMKAIAEYFRDLASDDRYFGAEPPQPDADMLARIAQREISRQVEASTSATGILLRATDTSGSPPVETPATAPAATPPVIKAEAAAQPEVAAVAVAPVEVVEVVQAEVVEAEVETPVETAEPVAAPIEVAAQEVPEVEVAPVEVAEVESVEVEAVQVEVAEVVEAEIVEAEAEAIEAEATPAPEVLVEATEVIVEEIEIAEIIEVVEVAEIVSVEADLEEPTDDNAALAAVMAAAIDDVAEDDVEDDAGQDIAEEAPAQPASDFIPAADSIAAKLQRIRAVVSQNDQVVETDDYTEDEHAAPFVASVAQDITQALNADDDDQPVSSAVEAADDEIYRVLDQLDASHDEVTAEAPEQAGTDSVALFDDLDDDDEDLNGDDLISDEINNILGAEAEADAVEEQKPQVRARIVKVKRSELQAAIEAGDLEEIEDDQADEDGSLTAEDEADLLRELASVEAELAPEADAQEDPQGAETAEFGGAADTAAEEPAEPAHDTQVSDQVSAMASTVSEDESDLSRLMDAADEKLDDPATSSSRESYGHMRAAVAAAHAERAAGGTVGSDNDDDAYREDLASVVRPRRPSTGGKHARRPAADAKPAPLKLVAEQRVDEGASQVRRGAVRPRRVMTVPLEDADHVGTAEGEGGFADFATRMGATELPDMLEAAAAYLSFVEGRDQFSRPQLMNKVRQVKEDEFNREDGLRSFGQLLRDGKIEKTGGGRFTASGQIGFRPDTREAG